MIFCILLFSLNSIYIKISSHHSFDDGIIVTVLNYHKQYCVNRLVHVALRTGPFYSVKQSLRMELSDQRVQHSGDIVLIKLESIAPLLRKGTSASHTFNAGHGHVCFVGGGIYQTTVVWVPQTRRGLYVTGLRRKWEPQQKDHK